MSNTVLLVDDNQDFLKPLAEYLSMDHERYRVITAGNGREALDVLARQPVFLVVSDIKMPEITGLHLLNEVRERFPRTDVILMTAYGTEDIRAKVNQSGCLHFIEKPFNAEDLRQLIMAQMTAKADGFAGTLKHIQLTDLIQMCCLSDITITVQVSQNDQQGTICIGDGKVLHAECGHLSGEEAFYTMLGWESGRFETLDDDGPYPETINRSSQSLLLEAARRADEKTMQRKTAAEAGGSSPESVVSNDKVRILVVDDSPMMCKMLTGLLDGEADMEVIDKAHDGREALSKIRRLKPDLITLDVNMPVMDGSTALKHIMISHPCPVVIISSLGSRSHANVLDFLRLGAVDFIQKPKQSNLADPGKTVMIERIRMAARARMVNFKRFKAPVVLDPPVHPADVPGPCKRMIVISSGPGGHMALGALLNKLPELPETCAVVLQAMPVEFKSPLADYLNPRSRFEFCHLQPPASLDGGRCYIGTPETGCRVAARSDGEGSDLVFAEPTADDCRDRFDGFLSSLTAPGFADIALVLLSGAEIGSLEGLRAIQNIKGRILAQAPEQCLVPHSIEIARLANLVDTVADLDEIGTEMVKINP